MLKRKIQLDFVKPDKADAPKTLTEDEAVHYVSMVDVAVVNTTNQVLKAVIAYMALDTIRKIAVNRLSK